MNPVQRTIRSLFGKPPRPEKAGASQAEAQRIPLTGVVLGTPAWVVVTLLTAVGCWVPGSGTGWAAAAAGRARQTEAPTHENVGIVWTSRRC